MTRNPAAHATRPNVHTPPHPRQASISGRWPRQVRTEPRTGSQSQSHPRFCPGTKLAAQHFFLRFRIDKYIGQVSLKCQVYLFIFKRKVCRTRRMSVHSSRKRRIASYRSGPRLPFAAQLRQHGTQSISAGPTGAGWRRGFSGRRTWVAHFAEFFAVGGVWAS